MFLKSADFNFFAKIMRGNYVFCCSSLISLNPTSLLNQKQNVVWFLLKGLYIWSEYLFYILLVETIPTHFN